MALLEDPICAEGATFDSDASIVLVGCRGSGKRSLGLIGAKRLGRRFITEDHYFRDVTGLGRAEYLQQYGTEKFYKQNVEVLRQMLFDNREKCVIECGMSSMAAESQVLLREYAKTNPVIFILRDSKSIRDLLKLDERAAERLEDINLTHRTCSNFEYYNLYDQSCEGNSRELPQEIDRGSLQYSFKLRNSKQDFSAFLDLMTGRSLGQTEFANPFSVATVPAENRLYTYALSLKFSDFLAGRLDFEAIGLDSGADVVELIVDAEHKDILKNIAKMVAMIRRNIQVPILFSIDHHFQEYAGDRGYFELLFHGLRLGAEYIAVDIQSQGDFLERLIRSKGRTKVIGDYFDRRQMVVDPWSDGTMLGQYTRAEALGCDIVRLFRHAARGEDDEGLEALREVVGKLVKIQRRPPMIAYNLGTLGHSSQVTNRIFTPVTIMTRSESGDMVKRDPERLTAQEATQALFQQHLLDQLHFYVIGISILYSLAPAMHQAAYRTCGLDHTFEICQSSSLEELRRLSRDPHFGGASISNPFKIDVMQSVKAISKHASAIGAVNTIVPIRVLPDGSIPDNTTESLSYQAHHRGRAGHVVGWYGDNTDYLGFMTCLERNLSPRNAIQRKTTGLVIGAGGMARAAVYAMLQLGCRKIFVYNRTTDNARKLASHFNSQNWYGSSEVVEIFGSLQDPWPADLHQPTIIVSAIPAHSFNGQPEPNLTLPEHWLQSPTGGVVVEDPQLAYKPLVTPLLEQFRRLREGGQPWTIVDGLDVLPEQSIAQFEFHTGRKAPRRQIRLEVLSRYQADTDTVNGRLSERILVEEATAPTPT